MKKLFLTFIPESFSRFIIGCVLIYYVNHQMWIDTVQYIVDITIIFWMIIPILEEKELDNQLVECNTHG